MTRQTTLITAIFILSAAAAFAAQAGTFRVHADGVDATVVSRVRADLVRAERQIEDRLGPFPGPVDTWIHPSRTAFSEALSRAWGVPSGFESM